MVIGENLHPQATDDLGWDDIAGCDAAYFTGGDPATVGRARRAPLLVVTARRLAVLAASGVQADVLIGSAIDPGERVDAVPLPAAPDVIVQTHGAKGGTWRAADGTARHLAAGARCPVRCAMPTAPATASTPPSPARSRPAASIAEAVVDGRPRRGRGGRRAAARTASKLSRMTDHAERTTRYAELVVRVGANVQPGQTVLVNAYVEQAPFARALAEAAYARGARYVDVWYWEPHVKRSRLQHAPLDSLSRRRRVARRARAAP